MFNELTTFLIYIISGMAICIFYDVFRVLRKTIKTSNIVTYIEDVVFWIVVCTFLIWLIFKVSFGELRSYIFIGLILGGIIYLLTFSKYFIIINVKILTILKNILLKIFTPILKFIRKPIIFFYIKTKKIYSKLSSKKNNINTKKPKEKRIFKLKFITNKFNKNNS